MRSNTGLSRRTGYGGTSYATQGPVDMDNYGRVVEVIFDPAHPKLKPDAGLGGSEALYGLYFQPLFQSTEESDDHFTRFAYCGCQTIRQIPIKGEIVRLEEKLSTPGSEEGLQSDGAVYKTYWTEIVPLWNHPHLNLYPDIKNQPNPDLGKYFKENADIKPLQLNPGDLSIEGRHGQTLRFGGTSTDLSPLAEKSSNGKPYIILRNGQANGSGDTNNEDIDKDDSSIYLVSDHKVPITEANRQFKGAVKMPEVTKNYKGKQIVANSDRIVINAREDNLTLAAKKHASMNAQTTSIDGVDYVGVDAKKIYLGNAAQKEREPVLLGDTTTRHMQQFYTSLQEMLTPLANGPATTAWEALALVALQGINQILTGRISDLPHLKSKKVFTE